MIMRVIILSSMKPTCYIFFSSYSNVLLMRNHHSARNRHSLILRCMTSKAQSIAMVDLPALHFPVLSPNTTEDS